MLSFTQKTLEAKFGADVTITGTPGRRHSFEITLKDGDKQVELYSKLATGNVVTQSYPDEQSLIAAIEQYRLDGTKIEVAQKSSCVVQ